MRSYVFGTAAAVLCAGALVAAQAPADQDQQPPSQPRGGAQGESRPSTQASGGQTTTVTGCVYREEDVPGRTPNIAERAGVLEDYILADVRPQGSGATGTSGSAGAGAAGAAGAPGSAAGATGTSGASGMYKLELIDDSRLQALVGKRVEVTGRIDREAGDSSGRPQSTPGAGAGAAGGRTAAPGAVSGDPGSAGNPGARQGDDADAAGAGAAGAGDRAGAGAAGAGAPGAGGQARAQQPDQSIGPDRIELAEFEVTSIREIAGTCAPTPAGR